MKKMCFATLQKTFIPECPANTTFGYIAYGHSYFVPLRILKQMHETPEVKAMFVTP
jgi:hypothetical protein